MPSAEGQPSQRRRAQEQRALRRQLQARLSDAQPRDLLRLLSVGQPTLKAYQASVAAFEQWCRKAGHGQPTVVNADRLLTLYFSARFLKGDNPVVGRYARAGWALLRTRSDGERGGQLPESRRALSGWEKRAPCRPRDCVPEVALGLLTQWMLENGHEEAALVVPVQWDAYLRPSEALGLLKSNVLAPQPAAGLLYAAEWSIVLGDHDTGPTTKTGIANATVRVGCCGRKWVKDHLQRLYNRAPSKHSRLFRIDLRRYEAAFRAAAKATGLVKLKTCPHAVRHTGPSEDRLANRLSLQEVQQRGLWKSHSSVMRYERHARVLKQIALMTDRQQAAGRRALRKLPQLLASRWRCYQ